VLNKVGMEHITYDKNRVINFSDAVFSIAMTLLVLEIAVPTVRELRDKGVWLTLAYRIPDFIGLVVSFLVSALYWVSHLRAFKYVSTVNGKLLWINVFLLLFVVLIPFSTAFYVSSFAYAGPFVFYCFNLVMIGVFYSLMLRYVYKKEKTKTGFYKSSYSHFQWKSLSGVFIWVLAAVLAFLWPNISRYIFVLIFVIHYFIDRYYKKKVYLKE